MTDDASHRDRAMTVRRATPKLLERISQESATAKFFNALKELHGPTDGALRMSDIFVDIAENKPLRLSEAERHMLERQFKPELTNRREAIRAAVKGAVSVAGLTALNTKFNRDLDRLNKEYDQTRARGESNVHIAMQRADTTGAQLITNTLGLTGLVIWTCNGLLSPSDERPSASEMQGKISQLEHAMDGALKAVVSPDRASGQTRA